MVQLLTVKYTCLILRSDSHAHQIKRLAVIIVMKIQKMSIIYFSYLTLSWKIFAFY